MGSIYLPYSALVAACVFVYFVVCPVVAYYRDPKGLRRFPNMSTFSGISSVPMMVLAHTGARSAYLTEMHKKHSVIRVAPNILSYGDVRAIKEIYGHNTLCIKDPSYVLFSGSHFHLADVIDRHDHGRKRKVLSSAYALKNLEEWEHKVADKMVRLTKHFDECCTEPLNSGQNVPVLGDMNVDFRAWLNFFTLDAISDIGLSEPLGFLDKGHSRTVAQRTDGTKYETDMRDCLYEMAYKQSLLIWSYKWYPFINKIADLLPFYGRMGALHRQWEGIPLELASRRLERYQKGEKLDDFFQALMEDKGSRPNHLEWGEIIAEVSIMLNAGSVTTAIAITNVVYQLLKNPKCMKKLRTEIDLALDAGEQDDAENMSEYYEDGVIPYDRLKHLPYLRACLDESLRLFPPTVHGLLRLTPEVGMNIVGDYVPGGVSVMMSALTAHRDPAVFPDGDSFIPERWLGEAGKALQPYFLSFSAGARGCIGRNISYLEQTVAVGTLLRRYEFALESPDWELKRLETLNWILGEMPVKVWRRYREKLVNGDVM
ncbi:Fc.00g055920.m01.CDS01 [Cosmosporella sp. VM-42]